MPDKNTFETFDQTAVIKVCGVGGGGGNAVNRMINARMSDVDFIAINTDAQDLQQSLAPNRLQIGRGNGLGAGAQPEVGRAAAEAHRDEINSMLQGSDMVFLALGLGGGTGTGAAPVVAQEARKVGALTVAVVTLPFDFEGTLRMKNALEGLKQLEEEVDTLIVVPNDRIAELSDANMSLVEAFRHGDEVLHNGVRAISELITVPGLINLDFADVRTIMGAGGRSLMGIGVATGENRAIRAAAEAINCPLLDQSNIQGAHGVIVNIRGGKDLRIVEVTAANTYIRQNTSPDAQIITGNVVDAEDREEIQITVIASGFPHQDHTEYQSAPASVPELTSATAPAAPETSSAKEYMHGKTSVTEEMPAAEEVPAAEDESVFALAADEGAGFYQEQWAPTISSVDVNIPPFLQKQYNSRIKP